MRALKHAGRPVVAVAMDGPRVVYPNDDNAVRVWNIQSGASTLLKAGTGRYMDHPFTTEVAIAGTRAAWTTLSVNGNSQETRARLYARPLTSGTRQVATAFRTDGYSDGRVELWDGNWLSGLVGSGNTLAVSRWTTRPKPDLSGSTISNARLSLIDSKGRLRTIASGERTIVSDLIGIPLGPGSPVHT